MPLPTRNMTSQMPTRNMPSQMPMRMSQKPAQMIRTAPIGGSQATRDLFASMGKKPSYKSGGDVSTCKMSTAKTKPRGNY